MLLLALLMGSGGLSAATLIWPGCGSGTLQSCIDAAAAGDEIRIDSEAVIQESLVVAKSLRIYARGKSARFGIGRNLSLTATGATTAISIENLWLSGRIDARIGSGNAAHNQSLVLRGLRLTPATLDAQATISVQTEPGTLSAHSITLAQSHVLETGIASVARHAVRVWSAHGGSATLSVQENQIMAASSGLYVVADAPAANVQVSANRVGSYRRPAGTTTGITVDTLPGGAVPVLRVSRNQVFRFAVGIQAFARGTASELYIQNNTLARSDTGVRVQRQPGSLLGGRLANNIFAHHRSCAIDFASSTPGIGNDYNLFFSNLVNHCQGAAPGANDRSGDPRFLGAYDFRTLVSSAAVNQGNNGDQPMLPLIVPIPLPDYDHRNGRVGASVDIGAHEFSFDQSFIHTSTAANVSGNLTILSSPATVLLSGDRLQMASFGRDVFDPVLPPEPAAHLGWWWNGSLWTIFRQTGDFGPPMPVGRRFHVLLDIDANQSHVHSATAANSSFNTTTLDHPSLNGSAAALPIVSQRFNPNSVYNNSSIGVWYDGSRWRVFNQQPSGSPPPSMPIGASFNVLAPNQLFANGHHAFRAQLLVPVAVLNLDHPLLNDTPCALPVATASYNPDNVYVPSALLFGSNQSLDGRTQWFLERGDGQTIPAAAAFHIYVDPQQSRRCREDLLLVDDFE